VIHALAEGLHEAGHDVTLFASGDSDVPCRHVETVPRACWTGGPSDVDPAFGQVVDTVRGHERDFDVLFSHLEARGFEFARSSPTPVVSTMHSRLDEPPISDALRAFSDVHLVAISRSQRSLAPAANWLGVVPNGLDLARMPFGATGGDYLLFVGRIAREKGITEAIDIARRTRRRLVVAAKTFLATERALFEGEVRPALESGRVEYVGEVARAIRDPLFAGARATLMLGDWPEPFGLVAIESLATGTPVIALRRGALPEIVVDGLDGFLVDDLEAAERAVHSVASLDRARIRARALTRFSASRMVDGYLALCGRLLGEDKFLERTTEGSVAIHR
jgi:glycosyltransferase involved in cell wall biosynthesis